jgi:cytochrome c oxidase subunit III
VGVGQAAPAALDPERPPRLGGGGPNSRIPSEGSGGGDPGDFQDSGLPNYSERLRRCRLGVVVGMVSILMLFMALTIAYLIRQHNSGVDGAGHRLGGWQQLTLPPLLAANTIILLFSSLTLELARRDLRQRWLLAPVESIPGIRQQRSSLPWLAVTLILGIAFLVGQAFAWSTMQAHGFYLAGNPSSSFFYLLTLTHALHLTVGIAALCHAGLARLLSRRLDTQCLVVDVTSWYWHFMALLWIYIYALLWFAR